MFDHQSCYELLRYGYVYLYITVTYINELGNLKLALRNIKFADLWPNGCLCCHRLVCLFLKRGADYNAKDTDDKDPIGIAIDNANADIVTL